MNFNLDRNNIVGFIAGFFTTTILALAICKFSYNVIEKGNKQEVETMLARIYDKDNKINKVEQQLQLQTKTVDSLSVENTKLKEDNRLLSEKINHYNSFKPITKILAQGDSWVDNELGIFIKILGSMTLSTGKQIYLEMKLSDSLSNSFYLSEKEYKSYIKTFRVNSENYKLTIKSFDPLTFFVSKND